MGRAGSPSMAVAEAGHAGLNAVPPLRTILSEVTFGSFENDEPTLRRHKPRSIKNKITPRGSPIGTPRENSTIPRDDVSCASGRTLRDDVSCASGRAGTLFVEAQEDLVKSVRDLLQEHAKEMRAVMREELSVGPRVARKPKREMSRSKAQLDLQQAPLSQDRADDADFDGPSVPPRQGSKASTRSVLHQHESGNHHHLDYLDSDLDEFAAPKSLADAVAQVMPSLAESAKRFQERVSVCGVKPPPKRGDCASRIVDSAGFQLTMYIIILLNVWFLLHSANWDVDNYMSEPADFFRIADIIFCVLYIVEFVLRLWRFGRSFWIGVEWRWNWLDTFLLVLSIYFSFLNTLLPNFTWLRMLRLFKLAKVLRVFRVIYMFKTLRAILVSLMSTIGTLFWTMVMLYVIIFMFGLTFTFLVGNYFREQGVDLDGEAKEDLTEYFGSVYQSTLSLYMCITGGNDWAIYYNGLLHTGEVGPYLFLFFTFFTQVAVMNIILGMFVNQAIDNMKATREEAAMEHAEEIRRRDRDLVDIIRSADIKGDGVISIEEWRAVIRKGNVASYLDLCGFRPEDVHEYYKMLCAESEDGMVPLDDFVRGCLDLRGSASKFDIFCVHSELRNDVQELKRLLAGECCSP